MIASAGPDLFLNLFSWKSLEISDRLFLISQPRDCLPDSQTHCIIRPYFLGGSFFPLSVFPHQLGHPFLGGELLRRIS